MKKINSKGMTLIELLISITLLSVILIFSLNLFITVKKSYNYSTAISKTDFVRDKIVSYINGDAANYGINTIIKDGNNAAILRFDKDENGLPFSKRLEYNASKKVISYKCTTCASTSKTGLSDTTFKMPDDYVFTNFVIKDDLESNTIKLTVNGKVGSKVNNINVFAKKREVRTSDIRLSKYLYDLTESDETTDVIDLSSGGECTNTLAFDKTYDNNLRFVGKNPCNYIEFNGEIWRIIGVMNNIENEVRVKIVNMNLKKSSKWTNYSINNWTTSNVYTYLNNDYYNSLNSESKDFTSSIKWKLGATKTLDYTPRVMYDLERSTNVYTDYYYDKKNPVANPSVVALMYPSDFGFAVGGTSAIRNECLKNKLSGYNIVNCQNNNYLKTTNSYWFLTGNINGTNQYTGSSYVTNKSLSNSNYIYPVIYLKSNVLFSSGTGTLSDPYKIK